MTGPTLYRAILALLTAFYFVYAALSLSIELGALQAPTFWPIIRILTVVLLVPTVYAVYKLTQDMVASISNGERNVGETER
jgi:hypothetical protein